MRPPWQHKPTLSTNFCPASSFLFKFKRRIIVASLFLGAAVTIAYSFQSGFTGPFIPKQEVTPSPLMQWADSNGSVQSPKTWDELLDGKKTVLIFWASWCPDCVAKIPEYNQVAATAQKESAWQVLSIHSKQGTAQAYRAAKEKGLKTPVVLDEQGWIFEKYGIVTLPSVIVLEKDQKIIYFGLRFPDWLQVKA